MVTALDLVKELDHIFKPKSIAIIGASNNQSKWGYRLVFYVLQSGFRGTISPINPKEKLILGLPVYPSVIDVPQNIDLAVVAVPAPMVPLVIKECVEKGVPGAIIISAGFKETGENGGALQREVTDIAKKGGMRIVGPNCMGIWSSTVGLNLAFRGTPRTGSISFVSQSGTLGVYLFQVAMEKGYGFSKFISSGNEADLSSADYIQYLGEDQDTKVIALYLEGVKDGRRFLEIAKEVVKKKPIIVYKAGRTEVGARATLSHTGSLAGSDNIFEAVCKQAGIVRVYEAFHPFVLAEALSKQPLPKGNRVAIIGVGGGYCVTCSDACVSLGLSVPEFDGETQKRIKSLLLSHAPMPRNPVDTAADPRPMSIAKIAEIVADLDYIDGIIASVYSPYIPSYLGQAVEAAEFIASIPQKYGKPVIATNIVRSGRYLVSERICAEAGIPFYETPEDCARAMAGLSRYAETLRKHGKKRVLT